MIRYADPITLTMALGAATGAAGTGITALLEGRAQAKDAKNQVFANELQGFRDERDETEAEKRNQARMRAVAAGSGNANLLARSTAHETESQMRLGRLRTDVATRSKGITKRGKQQARASVLKLGFAGLSGFGQTASFGADALKKKPAPVQPGDR